MPQVGERFCARVPGARACGCGRPFAAPNPAPESLPPVVVVHLVLTVVCGLASLLVFPLEWGRDPVRASLPPLILLVDLAVLYPLLIKRRAAWARVALFPLGTLLLLPSARAYTGRADARAWWTTFLGGLGITFLAGNLVTLTAGRMPAPTPSPRPVAGDPKPPTATPPAIMAARFEGLLSDLAAGQKAQAELSKTAGELNALALRGQLSSEQRERWLELLRGRIVAESTGVWSAYGMLSAWGDLDPAGLQAELWRRYERDGRLDSSLWYAASKNARRVPEELREPWARLVERIVRAEQTRGRVPFEVAWCWMLVDRQAAGAYFEGLRLDALDARVRAGLVTVFKELTPGSQAAVERLRQLGRRQDAAGQQARRILLVLGEGPQDEIDVAARVWRETGSREALYHLCSEYIDGLPEGAPFGRWLERLGEDTTRTGDLHVESRDRQASIYLEVNREGRLIGRSCGD